MIYLRNTSDISLNRIHEKDNRMIIYTYLRAIISSDIIFTSKRADRSIRSFTCYQVFTTDFYYIHTVSMHLEKEFNLAFKIISSKWASRYIYNDG